MGRGVYPMGRGCYPVGTGPVPTTGAAHAPGRRLYPPGTTPYPSRASCNLRVRGATRRGRSTPDRYGLVPRSWRQGALPETESPRLPATLRKPPAAQPRFPEHAPRSDATILHNNCNAMKISGNANETRDVTRNSGDEAPCFPEHALRLRATLPRLEATLPRLCATLRRSGATLLH